MNKKELKKEIEAVLDFDITEPNSIGIADLSKHLENKGLIDYSMELIETENDYYLQVDYYDKTIEKTIVLDYEIPDSFESIDYFIVLLVEEEKEMKRIKKIINN